MFPVKTIYQHNITSLLLIAVILAISLSACSKQAWYTGAQSAQTAHCLGGPVSEYEDCNEQSTESYLNYEKSREKLMKESTK